MGRTEPEFIQLFLQHQSDLKSYVFSMVPNWSDANDVVQRTSTVLWKKFDDLEKPESFKAWAFSIARYEVLNYRKKQRRSKLQFCNELLEVMAAEGHERRDRQLAERDSLRGCIVELSSIQQEMINRCYGEDKMTIRSVAEQMGRSTEGVYKALQRTRDQLFYCIQSKLKAQGFEA